MRTMILCVMVVLLSSAAAVSLAAASPPPSYPDQGAFTRLLSGMCVTRAQIGLKTMSTHGRSVGKAFFRRESCGDRVQGLAMLTCFGLFGVVRAVGRYDHLEKR